MGLVGLELPTKAELAICRNDTAMGAGINHYSRRSFKIAAFGGSVCDCVSEYNSKSPAAKNGCRGGFSLT